MRAAKIRRGNPPLTESLGFRKGTRVQRLCLYKYPKTEPFGSIHRKIPVASGGTTAYFGKRSGLGLGSWHLGPAGRHASL